MSAEAKFFPPSNYTRLIALNIAKSTNDNLTAPSPLTDKTIARLNAIHPVLIERLKELTVANAELANQASVKKKAKIKTVMYCSHFIQVFDLGVKRGIFKESERAYFGLPETSTKLPRMIQDMEIMTVAQNLIKGDAVRIASGGAPVSCPTIEELQQAANEFKVAFYSMSNCHSRVSIKQQAVKELTKEVRGVIRKIWAEVKAFYNELPREGQRNHGRRWGIVYAQKGGEKLVEGTITDAATGLPLAGVKVKLLIGRNRITTDAQGKFKLNTTLMHQQALKAECAGFITEEIMIELVEGKKTICNLALQSMA